MEKVFFFFENWKKLFIDLCRQGENIGTNVYQCTVGYKPLNNNTPASLVTHSMKVEEQERLARLCPYLEYSQ